MLKNRQCRTVIPKIGDRNEISPTIILGFPLKTMYELWAMGRLWNSMVVSWVKKEEIIWARSRGSWDLVGESTGNEVLQKSAQSLRHHK